MHVFFLCHKTLFIPVPIPPTRSFNLWAIIGSIFCQPILLSKIIHPLPHPKKKVICKNSESMQLLTSIFGILWTHPHLNFTSSNELTKHESLFLYSCFTTVFNYWSWWGFCLTKNSYGGFSPEFNILISILICITFL